MNPIKRTLVATLSLVMVLASARLGYAQSNTFPGSGNVGVGTTGPSDALEVRRSSGNIGISITNDSNGSSDFSALRFNQGGSGKGVIYTHSDDFIFTTFGGGNVNLQVAGGNVGIGTHTPSYTLDINGSISTESFYTANNAIFVKPQNSTTEGGHIKLKAPSSSYSDWNIDHFAGSLRIFKSGGGSADHYFHSNGNVGIGTSSPDHKLDVNGAIRAKEFFVETGWADFVFEDDYQLPSLGEVKSHIEEHGRLPGVPSAAEVQENGLEMSKAQTLMMQKIEELTLYMIQLKEENEALRSRVVELESAEASL